LEPKYTEPQTGYRYYTIGQSMTLDLIQYYKHMGFSLEQIKEDINKSTDSSMQINFEKRNAEINAEINHLRMCLTSIKRTLDNYKKYISLPKNGEIFMEYVAERKIVTYQIGYNILDSDYNHYEYFLRLLKTHLLEINFPMIYFYNAGTIIRKKYLSHLTLFSNEIYLLVDENFESGDKQASVESIPEGTYISMCCTKFDQEKVYAVALLEEAKRKKYEIDGDYICEVISEFPNNEHQQYFYKIQIKIR
jgi:DNA-binding transcriptional MerR regulator